MIGLIGGTVVLFGQVALGTVSIATMGLTAVITALCALKSAPVVQFVNTGIVTQVNATGDGFEVHYMIGSKTKVIEVKRGEPVGNLSSERLNQIKKSEEEGARFGAYFNINNKLLYLPSGLFTTHVVKIPE